MNASERLLHGFKFTIFHFHNVLRKVFPSFEELSYLFLLAYPAIRIGAPDDYTCADGDVTNRVDGLWGLIFRLSF